MKTIYTKDPAQGAALLRAGGLCAVPTETVYGLAGNGLEPAAVEEIYRVKDRPPVKPLSLLVSGPEALSRCGRKAPEAAFALGRRFWPGPLTIVVEAAAEIPELVRAGGDTVGLRCPDHPLTLALLAQLDFPLAAPSANPSGAPSPKTEGEVAAYFDGRIAGVLQGGDCALGRESTILDMSVTPYRVLRQGALPEAEIRAALRENLRVIGVTGGTGCGKTTALDAIRELGGRVIDCDALYHGLLETDEALSSELREAFPGAFASGGLDRKALGRVVFGDAEALERLNFITHRHVCRAVEETLSAWAMEGVSLAAVDAIALIESGLGASCAAVVGIGAPVETRVKRLMAREGISEEYARLRISAQKPEAFFRERCDYYLVNDGERIAFVEKCRSLFRRILTDERKESYEREECAQGKAVLQPEERLRSDGCGGAGRL